MIDQISEHSFLPKLLTVGEWVLDAGCGQDLTFSKAMLSRGMKVLAVDPNVNISPPSDPDIVFLNCALSHINSNLTFDVFNDPDAFTCQSGRDLSFLRKTGQVTVEAVTINDLMARFNIGRFDLIKLDIEGSEYAVLANLPIENFKQLSVEFHDFRNMNPFCPDNEVYYGRLFDKWGDGVKAVKHFKTSHKGLPADCADNYWDSLFINSDFL